MQFDLLDFRKSCNQLFVIGKTSSRTVFDIYLCFVTAMLIRSNKQLEAGNCEEIKRREVTLEKKTIVLKYYLTLYAVYKLQMKKITLL